MNSNDKKNYVTLSVDVPFSLKDKIKFCSYKEKKPIKDIVREALELYCEDKKLS